MEYGLVSGAATLREVLERQQTEDDMRAELVKAAGIGGWEHMHIRDSRGQDTNDFPDDWFLRGAYMYFWELKRVRGKTTPGQERMLAALQAFIEAHGLQDFCEARVVRPADVAGCLQRLLPDASVVADHSAGPSKMMDGSKWKPCKGCFPGPFCRDCEGER